MGAVLQSSDAYGEEGVVVFWRAYREGAAGVEELRREMRENRCPRVPPSLEDVCHCRPPDGLCVSPCVTRPRVGGECGRGGVGV